jgi:hypothetical protein
MDARESLAGAKKSPRPGDTGCLTQEIQNGWAMKRGLLPTPDASEGTKWTTKYNPNSQRGSGLTAMAVNGILPTPMTQGLKVSDKDGKTRFMDLNLLPTPVSRDYQPSLSKDAMVKKNGTLRTDALSNLPTMIGVHHSQTGGVTSQLNPLFVADMMGFPIMWCDI